MNSAMQKMMDRFAKAKALVLAERNRRAGAIVDQWKPAKYVRGKGWVDASKGTVLTKLNEEGTPAIWTNVRYNTNPKSPRMVKALNKEGNPVTKRTKAAKASAKDEKFARIEANYRSFTSPSRWNNIFEQAKTGSMEARVAAVALTTGLRVGSDYQKGEEMAYGATTLEARHVQGTKDNLWLDFTAKSGVSARVPVTDVRTAQILLAAKQGKRAAAALFSTNDKKMLDFTKKYVGSKDALTKDFRTALAIEAAAEVVRQLPFPTNPKERKAAVKLVGTVVGNRLGHTNATMSINEYIDPRVMAPLNEPTQKGFAKSVASMYAKFGSHVPWIKGRFHVSKTGKAYHIMPNNSWIPAELGMSH